MKTLIVGAGATGGYIGVQLLRAGRDVTFLVRPKTLARLNSDGIRIRDSSASYDGMSPTEVKAITTDDLDGTYDAVLLAVRSDVVASAIEDLYAAVGSGTRIVPVVNGMAHLPLLIDAFGEDVVLGAAAKLATSLLPDGTIDEVAPGVQFDIGGLDGLDSVETNRVAGAFAVTGIAVSVSNSIRMVMWEKFAFITSTAVLTCLTGAVIGSVATADGGPTLAGRVLDEVAMIVAAEGYPLSDSTTTTLTALLTDPSSRFAPSMFRDLHAGRPVETAVFGDMAARARRHHIATPLLDATIVAVNVRQQLH